MTYSDDGTYVPIENEGNTVRAWAGHRSVPPVTVTNIRSYVHTMVVITYVPRKSKGHYCLTLSEYGDYDYYSTSTRS